MQMYVNVGIKLNNEMKKNHKRINYLYRISTF